MKKGKYLILLLFLGLVANLKAEEKEEGVITFASGSYIKGKVGHSKSNVSENAKEGIDVVYIWHDGKEIVNTQYHSVDENTEGTTAKNHGLRARAEGTVAINKGEMVVTPIVERILDNSNNVIEGNFDGHVYGGLAYDKAHVINEGKIELTSSNVETGAYQVGMGAFTGAQITNKGQITGSGNAGMYVHGINSIGINEGDIDFVGANGMYADGTNSQIINKKNIANTGENGMLASNGALAVNDESGIIENKKIESDKYSGKYGMKADGVGSQILNLGTIQNKENGGMQIVNGATGINKNTIKNEGAGGMVAIGVGSEAVNFGTIQNNGKNGMLAQDGGRIENRGEILTVGENGMSASGKGSSAWNYSKIITSTKRKYAMVASNEGEANNKGEIKDGGMFADSNGQVINSGDINNSKSESFIIKATGIGINNGKVTSDYTDTIVKISENGYFINGENGTIESNGKYLVYVGADTSTDSNGEKLPVDMINHGIITATGNEAYAIYAKGDSTAINKGTINVTGDKSYGMYAINGATIVNEGTINVTGNNSYGMYATGEGSKIENKGTIILSDGQKITENEKDKTDNKNNTAIKLEKNATFVNSGQFKVEGDLDFSDMGDGKFEISQGGTVEADTIKGNFYASGALTLGSYEDTYSTYRTLKTDKIEGEVKSNSAMFTSKLTEKNEDGYYDIVMERKNFKEIVENSSIANALENSYTQGSSNSTKDKIFDYLKLTTTTDKLNETVETLYGNKIYPTIRQQSFDFIRLNNDKIKSNVLSQTNVTGEIRYIGGIDYSIIDQDSSSKLTGYITKAKGIYLGVDKNLNEAYRIGGIVNITDINTNFTNHDRREDRMYQGTLYGIYDKDNTNLTSTIFLGKLDGKLTRNTYFEGIESHRGDIDNNYFGLTNQLEHRVDFKHFYLKPRAEANLIVLYQNEINEKGEYALNVEAESNRSFETGIGFEIGKDIEFDNGVKVSLNQGIMYRYEFVDVTKSVIVTSNGVSENNKVKLSENDRDRNSGELITKVEITKNDFGVYGEYKYIMRKNQNRHVSTLGLTYTF